MSRLTYKSVFWGDYGSVDAYEDEHEYIQKLRNALGKFEDDDWVSINEDGYPKEEGKYLMTIEYIDKAENEMREIAAGQFTDGKFCGLEDVLKPYRVVAWRNYKPYEGK